MPEICRFYGIIIRMYFRDHGPAHFHAWYGGDEAVIDIETATVLGGRLPSRAQSLVIEWTLLHRNDLLTAWQRAQNFEQPGKIAPLD